jgi:hypothetical protein
MSIALALLQGSIGGVFPIILFFVVLGGGLLLVAVFGSRVTPSPDYGGGRRRGRSLFPARALCVIGASFAVVGAFFVSMATDILGMVLGMVGYFLGARVLGTVVVILSIATLLIGLLVGPAAIPGSYDQPTNGTSRPSSGR